MRGGRERESREVRCSEREGREVKLRGREGREVRGGLEGKVVREVKRGGEHIRGGGDHYRPQAEPSSRLNRREEERTSYREAHYQGDLYSREYPPLPRVGGKGWGAAPAAQF